MRIPLLIRYPRLNRRNVTLDASVLNIDLAPTLLQLAGVAVPATVQGSSMVPLLKNWVDLDPQWLPLRTSRRNTMSFRR